LIGTFLAGYVTGRIGTSRPGCRTGQLVAPTPGAELVGFSPDTGNW